MVNRIVWIIAHGWGTCVYLLMMDVVPTFEMPGERGGETRLLLLRGTASEPADRVDNRTWRSIAYGW
jgi:hypothetical protein